MKKVLIDCSNLKAGGGVQVASSFLIDIIKHDLIQKIKADELYFHLSEEVFKNIGHNNLPNVKVFYKKNLFKIQFKI